MTIDLARVAAVYADGVAGGQVGSGYLVADGVVLTAGHVLHPNGRPASSVEIAPHGDARWRRASVAWSSPDPDALDAALLRVEPSSDWPPVTTNVRWGQFRRKSPIEVEAVGFPWAQARPDTTRDTEHVLGFVTPATGAVTEMLHVHLRTTAPLRRAGGDSPWAGISGAALITDAAVVGLLTTDPGRYGTDRLVALPVSRLLGLDDFTTALGGPVDLVDVGLGAPASPPSSTPPGTAPPGGSSASAGPTPVLTPEKRRELLRTLRESLSDTDLRDIAADYGASGRHPRPNFAERLPGNSLDSRISAVLDDATRTGSIDALLEAIRAVRSDLVGRCSVL